MRTLSSVRFLIYLGWLLGGIFLWFLIKGQILTNPLIFSFGFLYILLLPGFSLGRLLKIENFSLNNQFLLYFALGLSFYFIVNLLGILSGISLQILTLIIIILLILLFIISFLCDFLRRYFRIGQKIELHFHLSDFLYLLVFGVALFILWVVYLKGPNLNGDPYFHLAIIRKALEGESLSVRSLAFTKTLDINPAYIYPAWHVFLAFLSRLFLVDIFSVWHNIIFVLTIVSFFVWYYLAQIIFEKKFLTYFSLLLWLILTFYNGPGYLFTRLGVPDTLAQLVLLPLGLAFSFKYIWTLNLEKKAEWQLLIANFLIALILLVLHGPHYFYLLLSIFAFGLFYAVFNFKSDNYKLTLLRLSKVFLIELLVLVLIGVAMELRFRTLSTTILEFNKSSSATITYASFAKFGLVYKYSFFLLPLIFVFSRPRWWLVSINMLLIPLIYFTPLKDFFSRFLSIVFTDRLLANLTWYFFVFSAVLAIMFYFVDYILNRLKQNVRLIVNILLSLIFLIFMFWETKNQAISDFTYQIFYAKPTNAFVNTHYLWFILIPLILAVMLFIVKSIRNKLTFVEEPKNHLAMFLLVLITAFVLISPTISNVRYFLKQPKTLRGEDFFLVAIQNDRSALNYLKTQIPQKSVILASGGASKGLSTLTNQYMAYNTGSAYEKRFKKVFDGQYPDEGKADIVTSSKRAIDYIYLENPALQNSHFRSHPELYEKIYSESSEIYKMIKI